MVSVAGRHTPKAGKDEWLTPPHILEALGPFDLDPCAPVSSPWRLALACYSIVDDGLSQPWAGRVWCNPPYGVAAARWLERMAEHRNGIALTFARTDVAWFHDQVWDRADALLFLRGRLHFHHVDGTRAAHNSGGPSVLIAYGPAEVDVLRGCGLDGKFILL